MGGVTSVLSLKKELNKEGNDIDVYLLYNLGFENWEKVIKHDDLAFIDKMVQKGKLRHKAFSCNGPYLFKEVVGAYDWEMAQIQPKVLDEFHQVGVEGLKSVDVNQTKYAEVM